MELKTPSLRELLARDIAQVINDGGLNSPYGGDVTLSEDHKARLIGFSKPATLDGEVKVYSPAFICITYKTQYRALPGEDLRIFTNGVNAMLFLLKAFVELDFEAALAIPTKPPRA